MCKHPCSISDTPSGITRYAYKQCRGWLARYYLPEGKVHTKLFTDKKTSGCSWCSQRQAIEWLLDQSRDYPRRPHTRIRSPVVTKSEPVGVSYTAKLERNGTRTPVYQVSYKEAGQRKTKTFRIHHYRTRQDALMMAIAFRIRQEYRMQFALRNTFREEWFQHYHYLMTTHREETL